MKTATLRVHGKEDTYEYIIDLYTDTPNRTQVSTACVVKYGRKSSNWIIEQIQAGKFELVFN